MRNLFISKAGIYVCKFLANYEIVQFCTSKSGTYDDWQIFYRKTFVRFTLGRFYNKSLYAKIVVSRGIPKPHISNALCGIL